MPFLASDFLHFRSVFRAYDRKPQDKGKPMPNIDHLIEVIEDQHTLVTSLATPEIISVAHDLAFYYAMLDAAQDDPLDDEEEQTELVHYLMTQLKELVERYQTLVNDVLPD